MRFLGLFPPDLRRDATRRNSARPSSTIVLARTHAHTRVTPAPHAYAKYTTARKRQQRARTRRCIILHSARPRVTGAPVVANTLEGTTACLGDDDRPRSRTGCSCNRYCWTAVHCDYGDFDRLDLSQTRARLPSTDTASTYTIHHVHRTKRLQHLRSASLCDPSELRASLRSPLLSSHRSFRSRMRARRAWRCSPRREIQMSNQVL